VSPSNPSVAFSKDVKHLFRHLHEPHILRNNPLVRNLFESPAADGATVGDEAALGRIHQLVRQGADYCRSADVAAGNEERARRQHAIAILQCLGRRPVREVAATLHVSYYHCYRERADICRRIARYMRERSESNTLDYLPEIDSFRLLVDRARRRIACGNEREALNECAELLQSASSPLQKVEALRANATAALRFGNFERAEDAYYTAKALSEELRMLPSPSQEGALANLDLFACELACHRADPAEARRTAASALQRLEPHRARAGAGIKELYVESLYNLGTALCNLGDFDNGYDYVASAEANLCFVRPPSFELRTRIMVEVWKLRNYLRMSAKTCYSSARRFEGLKLAFEQAYASGSFFEAADALVALMQYHALAEQHREALRAARLAVTLSEQQPSAQVRAQTRIQVALKLLLTPHWEKALSIFPNAEQLELCDAYHRQLVSYFAAERALRSREFKRAWELATKNHEGKEYATLTVRRHLVAAAAAHELNHRSKARQLIETAIPAVERLGSAPILKEAYRVAGKITGDLRFGRKSRDIATLLAT
jgi:hypothetical protein